MYYLLNEGRAATGRCTMPSFRVLSTVHIHAWNEDVTSHPPEREATQDRQERALYYTKGYKRIQSPTTCQVLYLRHFWQHEMYLFRCGNRAECYFASTQSATDDYHAWISNFSTYQSLAVRISLALTDGGFPPLKSRTFGPVILVVPTKKPNIHMTLRQKL